MLIISVPFCFPMAAPLLSSSYPPLILLYQENRWYHEDDEEDDDEDDGDEGETGGGWWPKVNPRKSSSQYKGVYLDQSKASRNALKPWRAQIKTPEGVESLGYFSSEESAAKAYDRRARGLNMALNLPNGTSRSKQVRHTYYMTMRGLTLSPG